MTTSQNSRPQLTPEQALRAIEARIQGKFDDPDIKAFGPLSTDSEQDILEMIEAAKAPAPPALADGPKSPEDLGFFRQLSGEFDRIAKSGVGGEAARLARLGGDAIFTLVGVVDRLQAGATPAVNPRDAADVANYLENEIQNRPERYGNDDAALGRWNRAVQALYLVDVDGAQSLANIDPPTARDVAAYLENEFENNKDIEPETLDKWRGVVNALREIGEKAPVLPDLAVVIEGGVVQFVVSSDPAAIGQTVRIIDYDTEGADPASLVEIPLLGEDDKVVDAVTWREEVTVSDLDLANIRAITPEKNPEP